jgi:antitoxin component of RelBE/YafQ-DinJ toxin-antitoxin module
MKRGENFSFRLSPEEKERFAAVASALGLTISAMMRTLVKKEARRLGLEKEKG